jgi:osmoprotectant transport system ATP-binding protein
MIIAENLSKHFHDIQAVKSISFEVKEGETMVLLGTSGCGKTTTLKMLNRLIEATSGNIKINGRDIFGEQPEVLRRGIGYVSQNNGLFPHFTVSENIAVVPKLLGWEQSKISEHSEKLLSQLKLSPEAFGNKYPDELSGGQKQRVSIARALIGDAPVLLMDEPFGALDPVTRASIRQEFLQLPELRKKTIVLVTHDVQEAFEMGDRICLMDKGEIVQQGDAKTLLFAPANAFVSNFFQNQRLLLEMSALTLNDVWDFLPAREAAFYINVSSDCSLWKAMELISESNQDHLRIYCKTKEAHITIASADIQEAFYQYKRTR